MTDETDLPSQLHPENIDTSKPSNEFYQEAPPTSANLPDRASTDDVIIYETQETSTNAARSPKRSILDLKNWISSSEDDSFLRNNLREKEDYRPGQLHRRDSLLKKILYSSPISERVSQSQDELEAGPSKPLRTSATTAIKNLEKEAPGPSNQVSRFTARAKLQGCKRTIESLDPIEESDPILSSPKRKATSKRQALAKAALDKEWREANKTTRRKNDLLKEMIIEISHCLKNKIQTSYFEEVFVLPQVRKSFLDVPLISWKRRVKARYNKAEDIFVPCEMTEICEKPLMLYYEPEDLVLKIKDGGIELDIDITRRKAFAEDPLIETYVVILVSGFRNYLRKLQALEDKQYRQKLLLQLNEAHPKAKPTENLVITASEASQLITELEVRLGINVFLTNSIEETIDWLHSFTYTIGSSLYDKFERNSGHSNFGNVRLGSDRKSTFLEMIKKFNLMTAPKAQYLYQYYGSIPSLYDRFKEHENLGTVNGKAIIPPTVNTSLRRVLTAEDCDMVITD